MRFIVKQSVPSEDNTEKWKNYVELSCSHSETKPTDGIASGSWAFEVDTGNVYAFDEDSGDWVLEFCFQE